jgi:hypothetical protein
MEETFARINKEMEESSRRMKEDHEKQMKDLFDSAENFDQKTMKNFSVWRDFLYKYYLLVLAFITGTGILGTRAINEQVVILGLLLCLAGIVIGFSIINLCFYLERKWIQINHYMSGGVPPELFSHPESGGDGKLAFMLNTKDKVKAFKNELKQAKKVNDIKQTKELKYKIRSYKNQLSLLGYVGEQFGFIERIWVYGVIVSIGVPSIGMFLVFSGFLK